MRTIVMMISVTAVLTLTSMHSYAQEPAGEVFASDGGAGARWWKEKAKQYPKCAAPANQGATLTGQIVEEAYKKPEDVEKVNELGAQREEVKRELQTCIATNYRGVPLQGGITENTQGDPGGDGPYDGGTGTPGTPGTGKTPPQTKKQPPLSGGTSKGGGSGKPPGHSTNPPASAGHGNSGKHTTPPLYVGTVTLTWSEKKFKQPGNVPYQRFMTDEIKLKIWDVDDSNVPTDESGSLASVSGEFVNGSFKLTRYNWRDPSVQRWKITWKPSTTVRLRRN